MTNEPPADTAPLSQRLAETVSDVAQTGLDAAHRVCDAIDYARGPGRPLDIISTVARKAPLSSLLVAFLLGVAFARRG